MRIIDVNASKKYQVIIGSELLKKCGSLLANTVSAKRVAIITDDNVAELYLKDVSESIRKAGFEVYNFVIENGEKSKNLNCVTEIIHFLAEQGFSRSDAMVALGGGVVGDITGFCASIYMRGISYIQIPTTFLAGIDSSIGGKTGVNLPAGKNLVGTFYAPSLVLFDVSTLKTLKIEDYYSGLGEGFKYAILQGEEVIRILEEGLTEENIEEFCCYCINIKREIVQKDEFEEGARKLLNLGHTFAHAIEKESGWKVAHGFAVGVGIGLIADACFKRKILKESAYNRIKILQEKYSFFMDKIDLKKLINHMYLDKKVGGDRLSLVIINDVGNCSLLDISLDKLEEFII